METQSLLNLLFGAGLSVVGWFARQLWDATQSLKHDVSQLELSVAENYVKKVDINSRFDKMEAMLEKLYDKLDHKADK
jgi:chaperonin cofactor prefoldin